MESSGEFNKGTSWAAATAVSVALHVVIVGLMVQLGSSETKSAEEPSVEAPSPAAVAPSEPEPPPTPPKEPEPAARKPDPVRPAPAARPAPAVNTPAARPTPPAPAASVAVQEYVVKKGDNLTVLARRSGVTPEELAELNKTTVKKLANLWVGQKIKVPAPR